MSTNKIMSKEECTHYDKNFYCLVDYKGLNRWVCRVCGERFDDEAYRDFTILRLTEKNEAQELVLGESNDKCVELKAKLWYATNLLKQCGKYQEYKEGAQAYLAQMGKKKT